MHGNSGYNCFCPELSAACRLFFHFNYLSIMRTTFSMGKPALFVALLLTLVSVQPTSVFSITPPAETCECARPTNQAITEQGSNHVSFSWDSSEQGASFKVWYYRQGDSYTSAETITSNKYIQYTNLPAGTYTFYVVTICGGETSQAIIFDDMIMI